MGIKMINLPAQPERKLLSLKPGFLEVAGIALAFFIIAFIIRCFSCSNAGGSDSYGYVSEAIRLSRGHLYEPERVFSLFGVPEDAWLSHPLGYIEKGTEGTVPTYPFGYPLLMVPFIWIFGLNGAFWVVPLLASGTVIFTYLLGRTFGGISTGILAAALVLIFPSFLWTALQPLSDMPATFFAVVTLLGLLSFRNKLVADIVLAASLGFGLWIRINQALLILPVAIWLAIHKKWQRLLRVALFLLPFLIVQAALNWHLFGLPWRSGYGLLPWGGSIDQAITRAWKYLYRLHTQQGSVGLFLLGLSLILNRISISRRFLLASFFIVLLIFFAFYWHDDAWWYFRFLLPSMPAIAVLESGLLSWIISGKKQHWLRVSALLAGAAVFAWLSLAYSHKNSVFALPEYERRYYDAARMAKKFVRQPAIVLAMQHSGSLRLHAGLSTCRYDRLPEKLLPKLQAIEAAGGKIYLLVEHWEIENIKRERPALLIGSMELCSIEPQGITLFKLHLGGSPEN